MRLSSRAALAWYIPLATLLLVACAREAPSPPPTPEWRLVETWRVGGAPDGPFSFDNSRQVKRLPSGNLVLFDSKAGRLIILDTDGKLVAIGGRIGSGPGEVREATGFVIDTTGDILVNDRGNTRLTRFSADGKFLGVIPLSGSRFGAGADWDAVVMKDGRLVELVEGVGRAEPVTQMIIWQRDFSRSDTLRIGTCEPRSAAALARDFVTLRTPKGAVILSMSMPMRFPDQPTALDPAGFFWEQGVTTPSEVYRRSLGMCTSPDTLRLATVPGALTPASREAVAKQARSYAQSVGAVSPELPPPPERYPWYRSIVVGDDGHVWVTAWNGREVTVHGVDGREVAHLRWASSGRTAVITTDHVYRLEYDPDGVRFLVAYRIVKPG